MTKSEFNGNRSSDINFFSSPKAKKKIAVVFDFDGMITEQDVFDELFQAFADRRWRRFHRDYHARKISLKEAYLKMAEHFEATPRRFFSFLRRGIRLRRGFRELLGLLRARRISVFIVSNGFDLYIRYLLRLWKIRFPRRRLRCHHAEIGRGRFVPRFNEHRRLRHGNCLIGKAETLEELKREGYSVCFFGNGLSDTPAAGVADAVFARAELARYCDRKGIPYRRFDDFFDVIDALFPPQDATHLRRIL